MPTRGLSIPERLSRIEGRFDLSDEYAREKWHKLDNDLTPLVNLPERLTRDVAKMDGKFEGRIHEIERTITAAIEKALLPVTADVAELRVDVDALKLANQQMGGAKMLGVFIVQTIIAALSALAGVLALGRHP